MREQVRHCHVGVPQALLWRYLSDYGNVLRLAAPSASVHLVSGTPGETGARYRARVEWEGLESAFSVALSDARSPEYLDFEATGGGSVGIVRFILTPDGDASTKVEATASICLPKALVPVEPFAWALLARMQERMMRKLHELTPEAVSN